MCYVRRSFFPSCFVFVLFVDYWGFHSHSLDMKGKDNRCRSDLIFARNKLWIWLKYPYGLALDGRRCMQAWLGLYWNIRVTVVIHDTISWVRQLPLLWDLTGIWFCFVRYEALESLFSGKRESFVIEEFFPPRRAILLQWIYSWHSGLLAFDPVPLSSREKGGHR